MTARVNQLLRIPIDELRKEVLRLERVLLANDGWRCDACDRVFSDFDENHGDDCSLCGDCAIQARKEAAI